MKIKYDKEDNVVYISFSNEAIEESDEGKPGIIIDFAADGKIVGIEILDASKNMLQPDKLEYEVV